VLTCAALCLFLKSYHGGQSNSPAFLAVTSTLILLGKRLTAKFSINHQSELIISTTGGAQNPEIRGPVMLKFVKND